MRRRTRFALVIGLAVAIGAAAGLVVFRIPILEALLTTAMRAKGVPAPRLTVSDVGWGGIGIADVNLGQAGEMAVRSLRLDFSPSGLLSGRLERVTVRGLSIVLDLTGNGPPLGSLQPLFSGGRDDRGESVPLPPISLTDFRIDAQTAAGLVRATGEGQVHTADGGETAVEISLQELALDGNAVASGRLSANLSATRTDATLALHAKAGAFAVDASATIEDPLGTPVWRLNVAAEAEAASPLWAALTLPAPQSGRAKLTVTADGRAPPLRGPAATDDQLMRLLGGQATGTVDFSATNVSVPDRIAGLDGRARLIIDAAEGLVTLRLLEDATLAATQISPAFLQSLGIPTEVVDQIAQGFAARLQAPDPVAVASRADSAVAVALNGTLHLTVPGLADLSLTLPADIRVGGDRVRGQLRAPADLRLAELRYDGFAELLEPTVVTVAEAEVVITLDPARGDGLDYRLVLAGPAFRLRLRPQDANAIDATITPGQITLTPGRTEIVGAQIEMPAYGVVANGVSATLEAADTETRIGFQIANARQNGPEAMFAPITVTGEATRKGNVWRGTAKGEGPGGVGRIIASGSHDGATARGQAHIALEPLVFEPGAAQPGTLLPALSALQAASGMTMGEADLSWSALGFQGTGTLALKDIGFDSPRARVEGLDLRLRLDSLAPPASPPRQTLTVRRLEVGLPLDRLDIRFQIRPTVPPSVAIETGEVFLGSGRFALSDLVVDPAAARQDVDLRVQDLSLAELFAILNIDGLDGDGRLSGTIPITFSSGTVVIENGRLAASAPGTIRFRSEKAAQILADQGESLDLVLRALEDFRYEKLTIDLEKSADDVGRMKLSLLGKNPAVLEGYPFQFNINIEANMGKLVTALTAIYQVPNDFLRRAWTSGR